ncbi:MAG: hypothetical protein MJZ67_02955 [Bacteroidales bacterium]|nr:hypothetical protein [Bacteroidales bacterium]
MKKLQKYFAIAAMATAALMTACQKEETGYKFLLSIQKPTGAKTTIDTNHDTHWKNGDVVNINGQDITVTVSTSDQVYGTSPDPITSFNNKYYAFYAGRATTSDDYYQLSESTASYTYTLSNDFKINASELQAPMAGVATATSNVVSISMQNLCPLLEVTVGKTACVITITELDEAHNTPLSGTFTTTYNNGSWETQCDMNATHSYELKVRKFDENETIYIPIPAGNHKLQITLGGFGSITQNETHNYLASHYYPIGGNLIPIVPYIYDNFYFGNGNFLTYKEGTSNWAQGGSIFRLEQNQYDTTGFYAVGQGHNDLAIARSGHIVWIGQNLDNLDPSTLNNNSISTHGAMEVHAYGYLIENLDAAKAAHWFCPTAIDWKKAIGGFSQTNTDAVNDQSSTSNARWAYVKISYNYKDTIQGHNTTPEEKTIGGLMFIPDNSVKEVVAPYVSRTDLAWGTTYGESSGNQLAHIDQTSIWSNNRYNIPNLTAAEFKIWESVGAVFLPCSGYVTHSGNGRYYNNGVGVYRTCTGASNGNTSFILYLDPAQAPKITSAFGFQNGEAGSVRLIYKKDISTSSNSKSWK